MEDKLHVKNFGPIKDAEIEVKDMMVFIGAQSSGKSTLAKLITILNDFNFQNSNDNIFEEELKKYNLHSFLKKSTEIHYKSPFFNFTFNKEGEKKVNYSRLLDANLVDGDKKIIRLLMGYMLLLIEANDKLEIFNRELQESEDYGINERLENSIKITVSKYDDLYSIPKTILKAYGKEDNLDQLSNLAKIVKKVFLFIRPLDSLYIPAERTLLPLISSNIAGLINNKINLPQHLLQIAQEYEKALQTIDSLDLGIIGNLRFKRDTGKSYIYHNLNQKILLKEASSGIQSILPVLLLIESSIKEENHINLNYVVEEPELNLYPEAQYQLLRYLVKNCLETDNKVKSRNLIITTHSPYILASINNLLLAHTKGGEFEERTNDIIDKKSWICYKNFNAYQVVDGTVEQIFDKDEKLIDSNMIDEVSEVIMGDFKKIASIKND